ncbi:MAG: YegS/Rv2252/BmrU family lipid kinase [Chitinophagales bacterium]|nr:YegS/Rv2252/BmrU family lipid kinase [Chitinophagales bacterium]
MKKIGFVVHGKLSNHTSLISELNNNFSLYSTTIKYTEHAQHAIELATALCAEQVDYLIAVGGDGTLNEVINGVMRSGNTQIKLGVLPYGSGNDFVKTIHAPSSVTGLAVLIKNDQYKPIDLLHCTFTSPDGNPAKRYCINITDVGMGGDIAEQLNRSNKWLGATLTYQYFIVKTLLTYRPKMIRIKSDELNYEGSVMNFCMCNGKYFGSGLGVSPHSLVDDGKMNLVCIGEVSLLDYIKNFAAIKKCEPLIHPQVFYATANYIQIDGANERLPIDLDGEFAGYSPMNVRVLPNALYFLC